MKKILFLIITFLASIIILLLGAEFILRVIAPQQESMQWFLKNEKYGHVNKPNFHQEYNYLGSNNKMIVKTNSYGHRYNEYNSEELKDNSVKKVLIVGDSFTFGYGVNLNNHFAFFLDSILNVGNNEFAIINSGVGSWGTIQEKKYALDNLPIFNPDIIILQFFQNDPIDDYRFIENSNKSKYKLLNFPGKQLFKHNSHLYRYLFYRIKPKLYKKQLEKLDIINQNNLLEPYKHYSITKTQWETTLNQINEFYEKFIEYNNNGQFILLNAAPWYKDQNQRLINFSEGKNIHFLDLYDSTAPIQPINRRLDHDYHWSPLIHEIVARNLSELILDIN